MKRIDRLPLRQRVVLVVAIGALFVVLDGWITERPGTAGWFGYAPNMAAVGLVVRRVSPGVADLVAVGLILVWALVSFRLLRVGAPSLAQEEIGSH